MDWYYILLTFLLVTILKTSLVAITAWNIGQHEKTLPYKYCKMAKNNELPFVVIKWQKNDKS